MPEAVMYRYLGQIHTVYYARPKSFLPVKLTSGETKLITWGCKQHENSEMPKGGWARLTAIYDGRWSQYLPKPVCLPIIKFMKTDYEGQIHWYEVTKGQYLQGLLAHEGEEYRVYIVTVIPELLDVCFDRWPRIVVRNEALSTKKV